MRICFPLSALACIFLPAWLAGQGRSLVDLSLEELTNVRVTGAALHEQRLVDAPANTTVVTAREIKQYGYRTLAEIVSSVRGFYITYDHTYFNPGLRGMNLPGDFTTRFVLLIDGKAMTSAWDNSLISFGPEFPLDVSLIEQVELIRGPSSAVYGSNGMVATINIVTRKAAAFGGAEVRTEFAGLGERKLQASVAGRIGDNTTYLVSGSGFHSNGEDRIYVPSFNAPETNYGNVFGMDKHQGQRVFAALTHKNWEFRTLFSSHRKVQPVSWGATIVNDTGTRGEDARGFVQASYHHNWSENRGMEWTTSFDWGHFRGFYRYAADSVIDNREDDNGQWLNSRLVFRFSAPKDQHFTVGAEAKFDLGIHLNVFDHSPAPYTYLATNTPDRNFGVFVQHEWQLGDHWKTNVGFRGDYSVRRDSVFVSPRAALIYEYSDQGSVKFLAGRSFRDPSSYELFFDDNGLTWKGNPGLRRESVDSVEVVSDRKFGKYIRASLSAYLYNFRDLIATVTTDDNLIQYQNQGSQKARGLEAEIGLQRERFELKASIAVQQALVSAERTRLTNSPGTLGQVRLGIPVRRIAGMFGISARYWSERRTLAGATLPAGWSPDFTFTAAKLPNNMQLQAGVRNAFNKRYLEPVGLNPAVDTLPALGRIGFLTLTWKMPD